MKDSTIAKFDAIKKDLLGKKVLVAFSGGVDSTVLASVVSDVASTTKLLIISSNTVPESELIGAKEVAKELELDLIVKEFNWVEEESLASNEIDRCYTCKKILSQNWMRAAEEMGLEIVVEGTTASETEGYRPGAQALEQSAVQSPFLQANITKDEIREYARNRGLSVADKPSMACLATRFPYGTEITLERLHMVETVEKAVMTIFDVKCVRARYHGDLVRIEVGANELPKMFNQAKMKELEQQAHDVGFAYITLDLKGYRTGSMDEGLDLS
ncbi:ATP-dependent sacrificial sulfur transferase LarE [Candidatus Thorarchaeota archaeon]|nr:MAG: ATP-dependent sacrificial sulfur transferase LarE [Candidatus Thorarchaeota archaeon]